MLQEELPVPATGAVAPPSEALTPEVVPVIDLPAPIGVTGGVDEARNKSLRELIIALAAADDDLDDPDFSPEALLQGMTGKVDAWHFKLLAWEGRAKYLTDVVRSLVEPISRKISALSNAQTRGLAYVTECLLLERSCRVEMGEKSTAVSLPGEVFKVRLRDNAAALQGPDRPATAEDFEKFPDFVVAKRSYEWVNAKVKDALKKGSLPKEIPARLTVGHRPEWVPNVPELETKRKKKP